MMDAQAMFELLDSMEKRWKMYAITREAFELSIAQSLYELGLDRDEVLNFNVEATSNGMQLVKDGAAELLTEEWAAKTVKIARKHVKKFLAREGVEPFAKQQKRVKDLTGCCLIFGIPYDREKRVKEWQEEHRHKDMRAAIGGKWTYSFTPTSLGHIMKIICTCGGEIDLTNYDEW